MPQKVILTLSDEQGYGWTETYYYLGSSVPPFADTNQLVYYRNQFLSSSAVIGYARITSTVKRNPYIIQFGGASGVIGGPAAPDFAALLLRLLATGVGYGRHFLRGIPEENVQEDTYVPTPAFNSALLAWANYLQGGLWGIRSTLNDAGPPVSIQFPVPNTTKGYSFFIPGAQVYTPGNVITVHQCKVYGYNGTKTVTSATATSSPSAGFNYSVGGAAPPVAEPVNTSCYARLVNVAYGQINQVVTERITHRPPGRIFGSRRGRRNSLNPLRQ